MYHRAPLFAPLAPERPRLRAGVLKRVHSTSYFIVLHKKRARGRRTAAAPRRVSPQQDRLHVGFQPVGLKLAQR